jgi:deoxyadenosine/deoxycytidine kinase
MYILEGNIGAGKSTLLDLIKTYLPYLEVVQEPVVTWSDSNTEHSLLAQFCGDMQRWSYSMETYTMFCRIQEHLRVQAAKNPFKIIERSLYSGNYCFAKNGHLQGFMSDLEWNIYSKWFDFLVLQKCTPPLGFIYLQTEPSICYERTKKRNRPGEEDIPMGYFEQLHTQHEQFLIKKEGILDQLKNVPVLVLDGSLDFESDREHLQNCLDQIDEFLFFTGDSKGIARKHDGIHHTKCCQ